MPRVKKKILNVLYQSDDNYAVVSAISIASLLENNKTLDEIHIFYCGYKLSKQSKDRLKKLVEKYPNSYLTFINPNTYHKKLQKLGVKPWHGVYVTWLKMLALADLEIKTDRVLYLNPHTIITSSLDGLLELDFEKNIMALAYDTLTNQHKATIGLQPTDGYYNCGIMLINHKKWLKDDVSSQVVEHLSKKSDYVIADQDLCNVMFRGQIKTLDVAYNFSSAFYAYRPQDLLRINNLKQPYFYSYDEIMTNYYSPKIIHSLYGIQGKPWEVGNKHPNRLLWQKYFALTPWKNTELPHAKKTLVWYLYDILPRPIFMQLYIMAVERKFAEVDKEKTETTEANVR